MKLHPWILALCLILLLITGCARQQETVVNQSEPSSLPEDSAVGSEQQEEADEDGPSLIPPVMDAALYRGTVTAIDEAGENLTFTVEQARGTSFGYAGMLFTVGDTTDYSFDQDTIAVGDYLEVYYGAPMGGEFTEPLTAIAINRLPSADICIYNGVLMEHLLDEDDDGKGSLMLHHIDNEEDVTIFHYEAGSTQIYLNINEIKEGDALNIYFSGALARSLPPQGFALEIRPYAEEA